MRVRRFAHPPRSSDKQQIDWPAEAQIEARVAGYLAHATSFHRETMAVQRIALCALACVSCTAALAGPASKPRPATVRQAAAASTGPYEPAPAARAADAPDRLQRAMRGGVSSFGMGCASDEAAPPGCNCWEYHHATKGSIWEGKLPRGEKLNGSNRCTRYYPRKRSAEMANMEVALMFYILGQRPPDRDERREPLATASVSSFVALLWARRQVPPAADFV